MRPETEIILPFILINMLKIFFQAIKYFFPTLNRNYVNKTLYYIFDYEILLGLLRYVTFSDGSFENII